MEAYTDFAQVYDTFMDQTPYDKWAEILISLIDIYGVSKPVRRAGNIENESDGCRKTTEKSEADKVESLNGEKNLVVDLGCGTGTLTELLAQRGFDMIGIDSSAEMLTVAMNKKEKSGSSVLYLCQDMREMDLYSTVGTVISVCDSVNYLLDDDDVITAFSQINNYLYPGGIFIFDFNTVYKYKTVIGDTTIAENRDNCSFIWENYYHEDEKINEYDLTVFTRKSENELFTRFEETHFQRGYTVKEMQRFLTATGMETLLVLDADTHEPPKATSQRIYILAREHGKKKG